MSQKRIINPIDKEIRPIYGHRSSPLGFISPKGTLNKIHIDIGIIYELYMDFYIKIPKSN